MKFDREFFSNIDYDNLKLFLNVNGMDFTKYNYNHLIVVHKLYISVDNDNQDLFISSLYNDKCENKENVEHDAEVLNIFKRYFNLVSTSATSISEYITEYKLQLKNDK